MKNTVQIDTDKEGMALALAWAAKGMYITAPNPRVGCVIVRDGEVIGAGHTQPAGQAHAEIQALRDAAARGNDVRGATAYVTLEPCSHYGRTPPCSNALIEAGLGRVVAAMGDPNPLVAGRGMAQLAAAGIEVSSGLLADAAYELNIGFFSRMRRGRPWVRLKTAASLDGMTALENGESQWITGAAARRVVHAMRMRHDAVMVGAGTARADDPSLTVRDMGVARQPVRVVISRHLDLPLDSVLARTARDVPLWVLCGKGAAERVCAAWQELGARVLAVATGAGGQVDVADALQVLGREGLTSVFCEGGGALAASLLSADLVDDLVGFTAGMAIGAEGQPAIGAMGLAQLSEAPRFQLRKAGRVGADVLHEWTRIPSSW